MQSMVGHTFMMRMTFAVASYERQPDGAVIPSAKPSRKICVLVVSHSVVHACILAHWCCYRHAPYRVSDFFK